MSHTRKYFHKAIQLKHINNRRSTKCNAENENHPLFKIEKQSYKVLNRDERIKEWTFMWIHLRFYRQLLSKLFQLFRWGIMVNFSSQYSNRNLNTWDNMPSETPYLALAWAVGDLPSISSSVIGPGCNTTAAWISVELANFTNTIPESYAASWILASKTL